MIVCWWLYLGLVLVGSLYVRAISIDYMIEDNQEVIQRYFTF